MVKPPQRSIVLCLPLLLPLTACGINLEKTDLEGLLLQSGDLPAAYRVNTVQALSPKQMERMVVYPQPLKGSELTFEQKSGATSYVRVFLFETVDDLEQAYGSMENDFQQGFEGEPDAMKAAWNLTIQPEPRVGEAGLLVTGTYPFADSIGHNQVKEYGMAELLFRRCNAVVKARFKRTHERAARQGNGPTEPASTASADLASQDLLTYTTRLDTRLKDEVCP
jgi:hypothetical protein